MAKKASTKKKLLIADDEANIRLMVRKTFEGKYVVLEAKNGQEAVDLALRHFPDIILMDVMMPETDGLTALNRIRNNARVATTPIIMFTGVGYDLNEQLARSLGAKAYLRKPVTPRELLDAVSKIV
ncbi:MAG: response regulator [Chloroflexota bacterium]